jgi:hypothetical protein
MKYIRILAFGCWGLVLLGLPVIVWRLGISLGQSPRQLTEIMLGVSLPAGVEPTIEFRGPLGPIPTAIEYDAVVSFMMAPDKVNGFVNSLGCAYPSQENEYSCALFDELQSTGVAPPGTAEYRDISFNFLSGNTVQVDIALSNN